MVHSFEYYIFDCNLNIKKVDIVLPSPPWLSGRTSQAFGRHVAYLTTLNEVVAGVDREKLHIQLVLEVEKVT